MGCLENVRWIKRQSEGSFGLIVFGEFFRTQLDPQHCFPLAGFGSSPLFPVRVAVSIGLQQSRSCRYSRQPLLPEAPNCRFLTGFRPKDGTTLRAVMPPPWGDGQSGPQISQHAVGKRLRSGLSDG